MATAEAIFAQVGAKGFHSKADVENYVSAFNVDDFASYFQYYAPDVFLDVGAMPGSKDLIGYYNWAKEHHQIAAEILVPKQIIFDRSGRLVVLESWTEFKGRPGVAMDDFFGWGPVAEGSGPTVKMIVFYHLDEKGRVRHLQPAATVLLNTAVQTSKPQVQKSSPSFRTKEDVERYISFFSTNRFDEASQYWAPDLAVHLGPVIIRGREENIEFFTKQRKSGMNEVVVPQKITLDNGSCVLQAEVTFTAQVDFPEGYFGLGTDSGGLQKGQRIRSDFVIIYDLDHDLRARSIKAHRVSEPLITTAP